MLKNLNPVTGPELYTLVTLTFVYYKHKGVGGRGRGGIEEKKVA